MQDIIQYIDDNKDAFVSDLIDFLKIPSISTEPSHSKDVQHAADVLQEKLQALGLEARQYKTNRHPIVYGEWLKKPGAPTVLFYGHYDVQPPEPLNLWLSEPFEPRIEGEDLFARGASDDKGQLFTHIKAMEAFVKTRGELPVNVKVIFEGEEEIGSVNLTPFVQEHSELLSCDCVVVSDTDMWAKGVPALARSLRGLLAAEVIITGANRDLHSGAYGGAVPNPINILCSIIGQLHDKDGRVTVPGFYDDVMELEEAEKQGMKDLGFNEEAYRQDLGLKSLWGDSRFSVLERKWSRPTLDVNGIYGGYQGPGIKTVIASSAGAKITMRTVPNQDPAKLFKCVSDYLHRICPESVEITVNAKEGGPAVLLPTEGLMVEAARAALAQNFGREPVSMRFGGSIPVVATFAHVLKAPCLLLGFGLPDDNLHSPNEKFNLDNYHKGIKTIACFLDGVSEQ